MQQNHSPLPWKIVTMDNGKYGWIEDSTGEQVMGLGTLRYSINPEITAEFIVRACNAHEELIEACGKVKLSLQLISANPDVADTLLHTVLGINIQVLEAALAKAEKVK